MDSHQPSAGIATEVTELLLASEDGLAIAASHARAAANSSSQGPAILLAHGFGQTRQSWGQSQSSLSREGYPSLSFDTRGHGGSARNPSGLPYATEQFVADQVVAAAVLGDLPVLVGASMGGLTGLITQSQHRLYSCLVLVDVTPRWEQQGMTRIHDFMSAFPEGFESFDQAAQVISDYLPQRRARKTPAQLAHLLQPDGDGRLRWHWDPRLLVEFFSGSDQLQEVISAAARTIDVPVLLISGGRSDLVSDATVQHFIELVPHAQHVRLPDATHMLAGDDNNAFTDALLGFLRAQSLASGALGAVAATDDLAAGIPACSAPGVSP